MLTVTIPHVEVDGRRFKACLDRLLESLRIRDDSWSAFWFLEFQARGAPHAHIFMTHRLPIGLADKAWANAWRPFIGAEQAEEMEKSACNLTSLCSRRGSVVYAMKYAKKQEQKLIPEGFVNCGRFWGVRGNRSMLPADIQIDRLAEARPASQIREKRIKMAIQEEAMRRTEDILALAKDMLGENHVSARWQWHEGITLYWNGEHDAYVWVNFLQLTKQIWCEQWPNVE